MEMKYLLRTAAGVVLVLFGVLLLLVLAWVASNWDDAPPQPRPAALALPRPQLSDEVNRFDALTNLHKGLSAAKGGELLRCHARDEDCFAQWTLDANALLASRAAYAAHGERCDALAGEPFSYEEKLPKFQGVATELPAFQNHALCASWWLSAGVLAWQRGDKLAAAKQFTPVDLYQRALLAGSHSLIGAMVSVNIARRNTQAFVGVALQDPTMAPTLLPLLAPLPDAAASAKRWMVSEAALTASTIDELASAKGMPEPDEGSGALGAVTHRLMNSGIAFHPQRTLAQSDARWLRWMAQLDGGVVAAVQAQQGEQAERDASFWLPGLAWRNTAGSIVLAVAEPAFLPYLARQADLDLHRELAWLAGSAQAAGIAPARRAEWSQTQTVSPSTRERLRWSADGRVLSARTWEAETGAPAANNPQREAIRIEWPATPN